ncbi:hypothetical protein CRENPOLYSF2_3960005 [Crenothrix polyspora]|uniref:Uncharacterized protein n=1 Tax=Crenothrix polyspora TaxID=360316 RepID=A0A1R4HDT3_9GAMM|nr:hypothetical protein CRENPOLYSF2_3960005 [Crenothrix polyspora]
MLYVRCFFHSSSFVVNYSYLQEDLLIDATSRFCRFLAGAFMILPDISNTLKRFQ